MQISLNLKFVGLNMGRLDSGFQAIVSKKNLFYLKVLGKILLYAKLSLEAPPAKYAYRL